MNWIQRAKKIWPGLSEQEADIILWACTNYPIGSSTEVEQALREAYEKSGGDLFTALNQADEVQTKKQIGHGL